MTLVGCFSRPDGGQMSGGQFDVFDLAGGCGNRQPVFPQAFNMEGDGLSYFSLHIRGGGARGHAAWEVRHVGGIVALGFLDDHGVPHGGPHFMPACFRMLFKVPGAKSSLGLPGMVTRPGLLGCLNCR